MNSKIVLTVFIAFIMITSVVGFIWNYGSDEENYNVLEYGDYEFKNINGKYILDVNENQYVFDNSPYEINNLNFDDFALSSNKYYFIFNPEEKDLNLEYSIQKLYLVLNSLGVKVQLACSKEEGCDDDVPIKDCNDHAFYFKKTGNAKVYKDNNCVVIEGDNEEISKTVDKINLNLLNI